jgi:hypothetical protein
VLTARVGRVAVEVEVGNGGNVGVDDGVGDELLTLLQPYVDNKSKAAKET